MTVPSGRALCLGLALLFVLSLPAVTARIYASDEIEYFAWLRSVWFDGDVSFENEYRHFYDRGVAASPGFHETFLERTTETGYRINFAPAGSALLWAPFYAATDVVVRLGNRAGWAVAADGFSPPYIAAVSYGSAVLGFLAVLLSIRASELVVGRGVAAAVAVWLGTPLVFYMYIAPPMSHAPAAFAVAAFVVTWLKVRRAWSPLGLASLGALAAVMTMVREQDAFFVLGPALDLAWHTLAPRARSAVPLARRLVARVPGLIVGATSFAVVFLPQAIGYVLLNGRLGPSRIVARKMSWSSPHGLDVLVSPEHGFFLWTPLALVAIAGLLWLVWRGRRPPGHEVPAGHSRPDAAALPLLSRDPGDAARAAFCVLIMVLGQVYVAGSVESWTVAGAFGQRRFVSLTPLLVIGLAAAFEAVRPHPIVRRLGAALVVALVWWNLGLLAQFGTGLMDRQRLELSRNAYNTSVVVPRALPGLAYRYFFNRASFYRPSPWADSPASK